MSEKVYRLNEGGLLLFVRENIPTQWRGLLLYVREDIPNQSTGSAFACQKRYTGSMEVVWFCMSEKIYRLNEGVLLLYVR